MLAQKDNDEKLAITLLVVGIGLITWVLEEDARSPRLLFVQKGNQEPKTFFLRYSWTVPWGTVSDSRWEKYNTCKGFVCVNFSYLLEGDVTKYCLNTFYNCGDCFSDRNIWLNENRFKGAQK